jgi:hypothetical protein
MKIDDQLREVHMAIEGALQNPAILHKLAKFGYNQKVLLEGAALVKEVKRLRKWQAEGFGIQKTATQQFRAARQEVHTLYMRHLNIVRIDLNPQSEHGDVLQLKGPRKQSLSGWLAQVSAFYDNIALVQEILDAHNITAEEIAQIQAMIAAIDAHKVRQSHGKSEKQQASEQSQKALKALQKWRRDFLYIARYALQDDKQQLEALGQVV